MQNLMSRSFGRTIGEDFNISVDRQKDLSFEVESIIHNLKTPKRDAPIDFSCSDVLRLALEKADTDEERIVIAYIVGRRLEEEFGSPEL